MAGVNIQEALSEREFPVQARLVFECICDLFCFALLCFPINYIRITIGSRLCIEFSSHVRVFIDSLGPQF